MYTKLEKCRISDSANLITVLSLGEQYLTGVFPKSKEQQITKGPLELVWCPNSGLLQMGHSFSLNEMYGENYGYRSGLNLSMVNHLNQKIMYLQKLVNLKDTDLVIDIGSNDATSLKAYKSNCKKVGIDPTGIKFKEFYTEDITLIPDFFSYDLFRNYFPNQKAKIITSIAMLYDLESPLEFIKGIANILDDNGIWHFEQSYMPNMLKTNSYDTVCHEHLEFYSFNVIKNMIEMFGYNAGFRMLAELRTPIDIHEILYVPVADRTQDAQRIRETMYKGCYMTSYGAPRSIGSDIIITETAAFDVTSVDDGNNSPFDYSVGID